MLHKKIYIIAGVFILIIAGVGITYFYHQQHMKAIKANMQLAFTNVKEIEYGTKDLDLKKTLIKEIKGAKLSTISSIDTFKLGKQTIRFKLEREQVNKTIKYEVKIVDTLAPIIELKENQKEVTVGETYDFLSNIKEVKDKVDGNLSYHNGKKKNHYYVEGTVDTTHIGEYPMKVIAVDKHGLKNVKECKVVVVEKKNIVKSDTSGAQNNTTSSGKTNPNTLPSVKKGTIQDVINTANAQEGKTYVAGGRGPDVFDCDGLIQFAFRQNGYMIQSAGTAGYSIGTDLANALPGDIIMTPNHARLFLGGFNSAQAMNPDQGIRSGLDTQLMGYIMWKGGDPNYTSDPLQIIDIRRVR